VNKFNLIILTFLLLFSVQAYSQIIDSIGILKDCFFLQDSTVDRVVINPVFSLDSIIYENPNSYSNKPTLLSSSIEFEKSVKLKKGWLRVLPSNPEQTIINFVIDTLGSIKAPRLISGGIIYEPNFDLLKKMKFEPAINNNELQSVSAYIYFTLHFTFSHYKFNNKLKEYPIDLLSDDGLISVSTSFIAERLFSFKEKWQREARKDIGEGKVYLLVFGLTIRLVDEDMEKEITHKYGFEYKEMGCTIPSGSDGYNVVVMLFLNKRNGEGWWDKFQEEYSKLITPLTLPDEK
jgi:hypothetical protein